MDDLVVRENLKRIEYNIQNARAKRSSKRDVNVLLAVPTIRK